jgi:plastocyanin domain-containing protein
MVATWNSWVVGGGASNDSGVKIVDGKQIVTSTLSAGNYPNITVQVGTPVKWTINAPSGSINGCNNRINIQEYGISNYSLRQGDNVIEFTPDKTGRFQYSCWMGMIRGTIMVTESGAAPTDSGNAFTDDFADDDSDELPAGCCGGNGVAQGGGCFGGR